MNGVVDLGVIINLFSNIRMRDVMDIIIVAAVIYKLYVLLRETRAEQLAKGIVVLLVLTKVSQWMQLYTPITVDCRYRYKQSLYLGTGTGINYDELPNQSR